MGQSIRYILTLPVGAEKMSVNTTYDEDWNAMITSKLLKLLYYKKPTNYKLMNLQIPRQTYR